jgi:hypothetical protein
MSEGRLKSDIRLSLGRVDDVRLFNNPVGQAWAGTKSALKDGSVLLYKPRRVAFGLAPGSGDLIGWQTVTITPDMVGKQVAVFLSMEVKLPRGDVRPEQRTWRAAVAKAGGIAVVVRSVADAWAAIGGKR